MKRSCILLLGKKGQVGWELQRTLQPLGRVVALGRAEANLTEPERLRMIVEEVRPDVIVNAAAYTAVDAAEGDREAAMLINGRAPGVLAEAASELGALLVHYSTDYVFDGRKRTPYEEEDAACPVNVYGSSKRAGEQAIEQVACRHLILRTSWVYSLRRSNFLRTMMRLAQEREELRVVDDQRGAPTWARSIAEATALLLARCEGDVRSVYHLAASGETSWHGFTEAIVEELRARTQDAVRVRSVVPIATSEYPTPAERPLYSKLDTSRLHADWDIVLPDWRASLGRALGEGMPMPEGA